MLDYAYGHKDIFKLILCSSEGTKYENMVHDMVKIEVDATHRFAETMEKLGYPKYTVDPTLEHMLVKGTPSELLSKNGIFKRMSDLQMKGENWAV